MRQAEVSAQALEAALQPNVRWLLALDDWYPNHGPGRARVKASIHHLQPLGVDTYRVLLSGNDDFALVMEGLSMERARYMLEQLPPLISQQTARDLGFMDW